MFTNVGWFEIALVFIVGLIVIGPERLPRVIEDARAAIYAARSAIDNAKKELAGELGPEFDTIAEPLKDLNKLRGMTPRAVVTRTLLDGDDSFLDAFDPKKIMADDTAGAAERQRISEGRAAELAPRVERPAAAPAPAAHATQDTPPRLSQDVNQGHHQSAVGASGAAGAAGATGASAGQAAGSFDDVI